MNPNTDSHPCSYKTCRKHHYPAILVAGLLAVLCAYHFSFLDYRLKVEISSNCSSLEFIIETTSGKLLSQARSFIDKADENKQYIHTFAIPYSFTGNVILKPNILTFNRNHRISGIRILGSGFEKRFFETPNRPSQDIRTITGVSSFGLEGYRGYLHLSQISLDKNKRLASEVRSYYSRHFIAHIAGYLITAGFFAALGITLFNYILGKSKRIAALIDEVSACKYGGLLILIAMLGIIDFFVYWDYLLLNKYYIFIESTSDSLEQSWPFVSAFVEQIMSGDYLWSSEYGFGGSALLISSLYGMFNPLNIIFFLFDFDSIPGLFIYLFILKQWIGSIGFYLLLRRFKLHPFIAVFGSLSYAFSAYTIDFGNWLVGWGDSSVMLTPWVLWGIEQTLQKRTILFLAPLFGIYTLSANCYISAYHILILSSFYCGVRLFGMDADFSVRKYFKRLARISLCFFIGIGMIGVFLIPGTLIISHSILANRNIPILNHPFFIDGQDLIFYWFRMFASYLMTFDPIHLLVREIYSDQAPFLYIGSVSLVLIILLIFSPSNPRSKIYRLKIIILPVGFLMAVSPLLRSFLWGGYEAYHRMLSIYYPLFFVLLSCHIMNGYWQGHIGLPEKPVKLILLIVLCLIFSVVMASQSFPEPFNLNLLLWVSINLLCAAVLIQQFQSPDRRYASLIILLLIAGIEFAYFSRFSTSWVLCPVRPGNIQAGAYQEAILHLREQDPSFYRIGKAADGIRSNEPMLFNFRGFTLYSSLFSPQTVNCLKRLDNYTVSDLRIREDSMSDDLKSLFCMKYTKEILKDGSWGFFLNDDCIPFGAVYSNVVSKNTFHVLSPEQKRKIFPVALVVGSDFIARHPEFKEIRDPANIPESVVRNSIKARQENSLRYNTTVDHRISGIVHVDAPSLVLFQIPNEPGWRVTVDSRHDEITDADYGMIAVALQPGHHEIELIYRPPWIGTGLFVSLMSIIIYVTIGWVHYRRIRNKPLVRLSVR